MMSAILIVSATQTPSRTQWETGFERFLGRLCDGAKHSLGYGKGKVAAEPDSTRERRYRAAHPCEKPGVGTRINFSTQLLTVVLEPDAELTTGTFRAIYDNSSMFTLRGRYDLMNPDAGQTAALRHLLQNFGTGRTKRVFEEALRYMPMS